jgi:hypothetical protein
MFQELFPDTFGKFFFVYIGADAGAHGMHGDPIDRVH